MSFFLPPSSSDPASLALWALVLAAYAPAQALVLLLALHRLLALWRWRRARPAVAAPPLSRTPVVTVQLPLYDERRVVERLIDAVARLRYPREALEIQVLDDSDDETLGRALRAAERHRARGVDIRVLHRERRAGFKAGALAHGLAMARGEILVVFDADFVPDPDFLERLLPHFADPRVGMVQARWGHLNREASWLTAAQAALLDAHFLIEHGGRQASGLFFNFNGTAGAWRRDCIVDAGGWQHDTLTEDLDLSYRAQLAGWRFVFDATVVARAELPEDFAAFRAQQRRWVRGSIQTARKLLPRILVSRRPWRVRLEAFVHLTANAGYPLALAIAALTLPLLLAPRAVASGALAAAESLVIVIGVAPVIAGLLAAQRAQGRDWRASARAALAALVLAAGLSAHNTGAVLAGLLPRLGAWERTPKTGAGTRGSGAAPYPAAARRAGRLEMALAAYLAASAVVAAAIRETRVLPFLVLFAVGLLWVGRGSWTRRPPASAGLAWTIHEPRRESAR